ncbi:MAG: serine hydrolase [Xanthomonadales bacterium]|nr:serine hydrolase [Xanthomonadales bacterium]
MQEPQGISETAVAELASRAMSEFDVPGMAIGIVKADRVLLAKGYGVREIGKKDPVDTTTLFKIASNSKAFTTAALATLVDDGLISWDDLVIDYIPEFRMHEPWVTANFTITDLLTHRSGLSPFKGDMLLWPEPNLFTHDDIIYALRYFEPANGFRSKYAYDNLLYVVAGQIIPRVSGKTWGEYVESRIMRPAGMKHCFADTIPKKEMRKLASPHGMVEGKLIVIERGRITAQPPVSAAAGGVVCSLEDMLTWARTQLKQGTTPGGLKLFSTEQHREMWKPRTILSVSERAYEYDRTHFRAYGLGWRLADVHGYKEVSHTGTLAGMKSYVVLIPELELGVVLLTNGSSSAARTSVMNTIVRSFMPVEQVDWVQLLADELKAEEEEKLMADRLAQETAEVAKQAAQPCSTPDLPQFTGRYRDPWFGDITIELEDGQLLFSSLKSPRLKGRLQHHDGNRFVVRWIDPTLGADAYVLFEQEYNGPVTGISMAKMGDGDFDFEDLVLTKVE